MEYSNENQNKKFLNSHIRDLELLVLQFGVNVVDVEKVIREIITEIRNVSSLDQFILYQTALSRLQSYKDSAEATEIEIGGKRIFPYLEDERFHQKMIGLPSDFKLPFILQQFHGFNAEEISKLLNQSEEEIIHSINLARRRMMEELNLQPEQFGKSLEFITKTYGRILEMIDSNRLFAEEDEVISEENNNDVIQKKRSLFLKQIIYVSLISVLFSSLFFISVTGTGQVDEQYIAKLEEEFEKTMEDRRKQLGLRKEVYDLQAYISNARSSFIAFKKEVNQELASGKELERKEVKKRFEELLDSFALPSEMAAELFRKPLRKSKEESLLFLESYSLRLHEIIRAYNMESNSRMTDSLSEDLQKGMEAQNVFVSYNEFYFATEFKENKFTKRLRSSLHPAMEPYISMLLLKEEVYLEEPRHPSEMVDAVSVLEEVLLSDTRRTYLYEYARNLYSQTFNSLTSGPLIYQKDLSIKDEYRDAWVELSDNKETSPMGKVFSDIVTEMRETNWEQSKTLRYIDTSLDLERALALAQQGNLQSYEPTVRTFQSHEYSSVRLPDETFQQSVVEIEKIIEMQADLQSRSFFTDDPLLIVGGYDLAQREGNEKVLWELTWKFYPYEDFLEQYEVGTPILDGVDRITFDPELIHYNRGEVYPILFERKGVTEIGLWLSQKGPDWTIEKIVSGEGD